MDSRAVLEPIAKLNDSYSMALQEFTKQQPLPVNQMLWAKRTVSKNPSLAFNSTHLLNVDYLCLYTERALLLDKTVYQESKRALPAAKNGRTAIATLRNNGMFCLVDTLSNEIIFTRYFSQPDMWGLRGMIGLPNGTIIFLKTVPQAYQPVTDKLYNVSTSFFTKFRYAISALGKIARSTDLSSEYIDYLDIETLASKPTRFRFPASVSTYGYIDEELIAITVANECYRCGKDGVQQINSSRDLSNAEHNTFWVRVYNNMRINEYFELPGIDSHYLVLQDRRFIKLFNYEDPSIPEQVFISNHLIDQVIPISRWQIAIKERHLSCFTILQSEFLHALNANNRKQPGELVTLQVIGRFHKALVKHIPDTDAADIVLDYLDRNSLFGQSQLLSNAKKLKFPAIKTLRTVEQ